MWKWISRIVLTLAVLILALRIGDRLTRRGNALPAVPTPNAYDTLLDEARSIMSPAGDTADLPVDALRQLAETNRAALGRIRPALRADSGVPLQTTPGWPDQHAEDLKRLKKLAVALAIQSQVDSKAGRTNEAAASLLDVILLGQTLARGGVLVDGITGLAVEMIGTASLRSRIPHLDAATSRQLAQDLERAESERESPGQIVKNERAWSNASFGLVSRLGGLLLRKAESRRHADFNTRALETARRTRQLMLRIGARAVELDTGRPVTNAAVLVPAVLSALPLDPETRIPMTAIPAGDVIP